MEKKENKLSLFSKETLDSIALAGINGGEASNTYCAGAKCQCTEYGCGAKLYKCSNVIDPDLPLLPEDPNPPILHMLPIG